MQHLWAPTSYHRLTQATQVLAAGEDVGRRSPTSPQSLQQVNRSSRRSSGTWFGAVVHPLP